MIYVIIGPTSIGKTKLSIELAKHLNTEIISGDSVQVYKDLNIGSAKVTKEEMQGVTHHLIDLLNVEEEFSVALYQKLVREKIREFEMNNKIPLIVGGTGLYIKSVLYDYNFDGSFRNKEQESLLEKLSNDELFSILQEKDYDSSLTIHKNNRKRVIQAIIRATSNKMSNNKNKDVKLYNFKIIGLTIDRETLYQRINKRVDVMMKNGLLDEVKSLYDKGLRRKELPYIGYQEFIPYFDNEISLEEAVELVKRNSRRLAKKQYTFFNNQFDVNWVTVNLDDFNKTVQEVINLVSD